MDLPSYTAGLHTKSCVCFQRAWRSYPNGSAVHQVLSAGDRPHWDTAPHAAAGPNARRATPVSCGRYMDVLTWKFLFSKTHVPEELLGTMSPKDMFGLLCFFMCLVGPSFSY